jgi:hypothetical protein
MGEDSTKGTAASSANGLGFSPASTEWSVPYVSDTCEEYGDGIPIQQYIELPPTAWAYYAKGISTR